MQEGILILEHPVKRKERNVVNEKTVYKDLLIPGARGNSLGSDGWVLPRELDMHAPHVKNELVEHGPDEHDRYVYRELEPLLVVAALEQTQCRAHSLD